MTQRYDVAAYVWPSYTGDEPRTRIFWPEGMGEWESVRKAVKKTPDHDWPRKPRWGYVNEADPYVMRMQIDAAADHGVNVFIYDWYWYDRRPFLENCLNDGFLKAPNNDRMKFYLMWANHTATHLWDIRNFADQSVGIWEGAVDFEEFKRLGQRLVDQYFTHPRYYAIDGKPVFMVYDLPNLLLGLGGVDAARAAMDWLRERAARAGLAGLHWQLMEPGAQTIDIAGQRVERADAVARMGWDSVTHYQMCCFGFTAGLDRPSYPDLLATAERKWAETSAAYGIPYFPQVALGWANNPRSPTLTRPIVRDATPANVEKAFRAARAFVDAHPEQAPLITVNSWNEWTETSYLQPDDVNGYGYLEAVKEVFG
jgi:hypothetical protein